jgi:choline monooxygenase
MLFASLAPEAPLRPVLERIEERVGYLPIGEAVADARSVRAFDFDANWALYCDNYLEGFHIPYVHPGLRSALDYPSYETETFPGGVLQIGIADGDEPCFDPPAGHVDHGRRVAAYYYWLFPCTMLNFYPWGISVNVVLPRGPTRTRVVFVPRVWAPELREQGAGSGLERVEMEDEQVVLAVQDGVRSRLYDRGRYSPRRERGVHHFHRTLAGFLLGESEE